MFSYLFEDLIDYILCMKIKMGCGNGSKFFVPGLLIVKLWSFALTPAFFFAKFPPLHAGFWFETTLMQFPILGLKNNYSCLDADCF